jgi:hypothetical protein
LRAPHCGAPVFRGLPMPFVNRDSDGRVVSVSLERTVEHQEELASDHPAVVAFVDAVAQGQNDLATTDLRLVRVLEDLIDLLIERQVLSFTDFPEVVQRKLLERQSIRSSIRSLQLLSREDDGGLL